MGISFFFFFYVFFSFLFFPTVYFSGDFFFYVICNLETPGRKASSEHHHRHGKGAPVVLGPRQRLRSHEGWTTAAATRWSREETSSRGRAWPRAGQGLPEIVTMGSVATVGGLSLVCATKRSSWQRVGSGSSHLST